MLYSIKNYKLKKELLSQLQHHGIKGMRWGVRRQRGPDGRIIPGKYVTGNESSSSGRGDIGGYVQDSKDDGMPFLLRALFKRKLKQFDKHVEKTKPKSFDEIPKQKPLSTKQENIKRTNPKFNEGINYQLNCTNCVIAYEMRSRGLDVQANAGFVRPSNSTAKFMEGFKHKQHTGAGSYSKLMQEFETWPDGARGVFEMFIPTLGVGHIMNVEKQNGKITFIEAQSPPDSDAPVGTVDLVGLLNKPTKQMNETLSGKNGTSGAGLIVGGGRTDNLEFKERALETVIVRR